jgi:hypothetical protein
MANTLVEYLSRGQLGCHQHDDAILKLFSEFVWLFIPLIVRAEPYLQE